MPNKVNALGQSKASLILHTQNQRHFCLPVICGVMPIERHEMKVRYFALLAFVIVIAGSGYTFAHVLERPPDPIKPEFSEPHEVIVIYFKAVNRGELKVFDRTLQVMQVMGDWVMGVRLNLPQFNGYF